MNNIIDYKVLYIHGSADITKEVMQDINKWRQPLWWAGISWSAIVQVMVKYEEEDSNENTVVGGEYLWKQDGVMRVKLTHKDWGSPEIISIDPFEFDEITRDSDDVVAAEVFTQEEKDAIENRPQSMRDKENRINELVSNDVVGAWKPKHSEVFYYIHGDLSVEEDEFMNLNTRDEAKLKQWNYFKTKEDAEAVRDLKLYILDNWEEANQQHPQVSYKFWRNNSHCLSLIQRCKEIDYQNNNRKKFIWLQGL